MSSSWRTVASPKAESFSSGTYCDAVRVLVERAVGDQHRADRAEEGLGHRHRDVLALGPEHAEVALVDDAALVQHDDAVGVVGRPATAPRSSSGRCPARWKLTRVDVVALGARQRHRRASPRDTLLVGTSWRKFENDQRSCGKRVAAAVGKADRRCRAAAESRPSSPSSTGSLATASGNAGARSGPSHPGPGSAAGSRTGVAVGYGTGSACGSP